MKNKNLVELYNSRQMFANALRLAISDMLNGSAPPAFIKTCMQGYIIRGMLPENEHYKLIKEEKNNN